MTTMLAARVDRGSTAPTLEKIDAPVCGPDDVLVRVASAGLAPGMMELLARGAFRHLPTTPGHEAAGTVEAVGVDVEESLLGARVRVHPMLSCGRCVDCRNDREMACASESAIIGHAAFGTGRLALYARYHDGGLAELMRVPRHLVDVLPDNVSFDVAAKVHDLGNAVRALKQTDLPLGGTLVVTAATGTMGTATIKLAAPFGVGRLILVGRDRERLNAVAALAGTVPVETIALGELGEDWGATGGLTRAIRALTPSGADAVVDYFPDGPGSTQALAALRTGAALVHMGANSAPIPLPAVVIMANMWRIVGTRACTRTDTDQVLAMLASGALQVDELITHRWPLTEVVEALAELRTRSLPLWMAVINP